MAGIGFALGLAYLNLERFRYRAKIRDFAAQSISRFNTEGVKEKGELQSGYGRIQRYATLANNGHTDRIPSNRIVKLGKGVWCAIYGWLFEFHSDRDFVGLFTFLAALTIVLGVAENTFAHLKPMQSPDAQKLFFWLALTSMLLPPFFVWIGNKVVVDAKNQIDEDTNDVLKPMVDDAQSARAPKQKIKK
jgi:hypothetical protein